VNQQKTGEFLKHLRKTKGLTQEQLAEKFCVSSRTVSRWETGANMPDLSLLVELADFYDVDIREIIDGERKGENMDRETKDMLKKVASYVTAKDREKRLKALYFVVGMSVMALLTVVLFVLEGRGELSDAAPGLSVLFFFASIGGGFSVLCVWVSAFREEPSYEPERTVTATVISKEVVDGTNKSGRSVMGYSFVVYFRTEDGEDLEIYTYDVEWGGLKEGMTGKLTHQGRYFVDFEETA
jgi:transcriptional regulator with XRE-family HTH domain